MVATIGITFTLQATYSETRAVDLGVRAALAAMSLYILFSFNDIASDIVSIGVISIIAYWVVVRRKIVSGAAPPSEAAMKPALASARIGSAPAE
jgi:hypothetical protein